MHLQRYSKLGLSALIALSFMILPVDVQAQYGGTATVSAVTLQVVPGQNGQQSVVTPRGMVVPLPGAGVNSNVVQVYMGSQGGYWYIDRNGQNVDLTAYVQQMKSMGGQPPQTVPQYSPAPPPQESSSSSSSSSSGGSGLGTAVMAGAGAFAGAAVAGSYYNNVPYGTPVYYPRGGTPYYHSGGGNTVNVEHSNTVNNNASYYSSHANTVEQQQQWYANQQKANPDQAKAWQNHQATGQNPFVRQDGDGQGGGRFGRGGAGNNPTTAGNPDNGGGRRGMRGRKEAGGDSPNLQAGDGGGRFQGDGGARDGGALQQQSGGGRFQRGGGGGRRRR